jgi:hypothetical protein
MLTFSRVEGQKICPIALPLLVGGNFLRNGFVSDFFPGQGIRRGRGLGPDFGEQTPSDRADYSILLADEMRD